MGFDNLPNASARVVRLAAAGDVHSREARRDDLERSFEMLAGERIDLVLLAGDLTTWGKPDEARILAAACRHLSAPVVAVLGNHDWHEGRAGEVAAALREGGIELLDRSWTVHRVEGIEVGIVGVKGFVGGFGLAQLPDFGEPLLREVYSETSRDVEAMDAGLRAIANCSLRIVLLHYSPIETTLEGELREIWPFLGAERLATPILEHRPDLVLHGHAHAGSPEGRIEKVPVHNVSASVIGSDFWIVEMSIEARSIAPIH